MLREKQGLFYGRRIFQVPGIRPIFFKSGRNYRQFGANRPDDVPSVIYIDTETA
jgi:hypothetical protein